MDLAGSERVSRSEAEGGFDQFDQALIRICRVFANVTIRELQSVCAPSNNNAPSLCRTDYSIAGDRLTEAQHINRSLSALGDVMTALAGRSSHVSTAHTVSVSLCKQA